MQENVLSLKGTSFFGKFLHPFFSYKLHPWLSIWWWAMETNNCMPRVSGNTCMYCSLLEQYKAISNLSKIFYFFLTVFIVTEIDKNNTKYPFYGYLFYGCYSTESFSHHMRKYKLTLEFHRQHWLSYLQDWPPHTVGI